MHSADASGRDGTPTTDNATPGGNGTYSFPGGVASLSGGLFNGWTFQDANTYTSSVTESGGVTTITFGTSPLEVPLGSNADGPRKAVAFYKTVKGAFDIAFRIASVDGLGNLKSVQVGAWQVAMSGGANDSVAQVGMFGRVNTTTGKHWRKGSNGAVLDTDDDATAVNWNVDRWLRVRRYRSGSSDIIEVSKSTVADPGAGDWTVVSSFTTTMVPNICRLGIGFAANATGVAIQVKGRKATYTLA